MAHATRTRCVCGDTYGVRAAHRLERSARADTVRRMNQRTHEVLGFTVAVLLVSCGGATASGVAVGKVGQGLSAQARGVPQGAGVCSLKEAMAAQPGAEKPASESQTCTRLAKSDKLYHRAIVVLGAHGQTLEEIASGNGGDHAGKLEAAQTGVSGPNWIDVDDGQEKATREAVAQLVNQMSTSSAKGDLEKAIKDAAPHVKTICDALKPYLDAQSKAFGEIQQELEKKRVARTDRRCTTIDSRPICLPDTSTDRVVYTQTVADLAALESSHADARDAVAAFCAAHLKLEGAAAKGQASDDATYGEIVEAVKSSQNAPPAAPAATAQPAAPPAK